MPNDIYIGKDNLSKAITNFYIGLDNTAVEITKAYVGVGNTAKLFYQKNEVIVHYPTKNDFPQ